MTTQATDTAPAPPPAAVQASNAAQALRAAELLLLERAAVTAVTGPLRAQLVAVQRLAVRAWIRKFGSLRGPGDPIRAAAVTTEVQGALARVRVDGSAVLGGYTQRALVLGVQQGAREAGVNMTAHSIGATVDLSTARIVAGLDQAVAAAIADAEQAVSKAAGGTFAEVDAALGKAHAAVPRAAAATVTAVNGGANAGRRAVADELGAALLDLAEPDCCTTCAGLAGRTAAAGQPFDSRFLLTFTDKPHIWPDGPLHQPPWHPHCRCECVIYLGVQSGATGLSLPEALQREARRAIYKGWSLPSESGPERIRAARKLLARNAVAPTTVKAYARRAVAAGKFPNRTVPHRTSPARRAPTTKP